MSDSAITSTIYSSVASSKVVKTWFVHSLGCLSLNSSAKIPELTSSWWLISRSVRINALVNHGGFPLTAAITWSHSLLRTPAVCYIISGQLSTSIRLYSHPIACCFLFLLLPVSRTILNCASKVILLVAACAGSWCTEWCLRCSWVSVGGVLDDAPIVLPNSDPLAPWWGVSAAMICRCGS